VARRKEAGERRHDPKQIAGAIGCLGAAIGVAAHAAATGFTGSTAVSQGGTQAGDLYFSIPGAGYTNGVGGNRMTLAVTDMYSTLFSTWRQRAVDITNAGNIDLSTFTITTVGDNTNALATGGHLVMAIEECSVAWTENGSTPDQTYTCGGSMQLVLGTPVDGPTGPTDYSFVNGTTPVVFSTSGSPALTNIATAHSAVNHLCFFYKESATAPNNEQGLSVNVTFTFGGTQRNGTNA
jgi:hypothetical protein